MCHDSSAEAEVDEDRSFAIHVSAGTVFEQQTCGDASCDWTKECCSAGETCEPLASEGCAMHHFRCTRAADCHAGQHCQVDAVGSYWVDSVNAMNATHTCVSDRDCAGSAV